MDVNTTTAHMRRIRAVTFDAYATLFNIEGIHTKATELKSQPVQPDYTIECLEEVLDIIEIYW